MPELKRVLVSKWAATKVVNGKRLFIAEKRWRNGDLRLTDLRSEARSYGYQSKPDEPAPEGFVLRRLLYTEYRCVA